MIFYNEEQAMNACSSEPSLIFNLIKDGHFSVVDKILSENLISINTRDEENNDILMRLLKSKEFDLVLKHMHNKDWNVNNQNIDGDTFAHYLVTIDSLYVAKIIDELRRNNNFMPNIKNNNNETILDKSIKGNKIYTSMKILEDKRFNCIDIISFRKLYKAYIKSSYYGKYSKLTNLEVIVDNLEKKDTLLPKMQDLLDSIADNMEEIKKELLVNKSNNLEHIINSFMVA